MDEELIELTTEESVDIETSEIIEDEVKLEDLNHSVDTEEVIETIEVESVDEIEIEAEEAIGWVGGHSTRHNNLSGREEPKQHPIQAIEDLREKLDNIEALDVVYSYDKNQADYYLWEDGNVLQEDRIGYFVSIYPDTDKIEICKTGDILGVTVDSVGFIGGCNYIDGKRAEDSKNNTKIRQDMDSRYGLVVTSGIVKVRCETSVEVGNYVVPNNYGMARKIDNDCGYKVIDVDNNDIKYATIILNISANKIHNLSNAINEVDQEVKSTINNVTAAMNLANEAYNKVGEATAVSEEAVKEALEALKKSEETSGLIKNLEDNISENNKIAVEARQIAANAELAAIDAKNQAITISDQALADVNDLIENLEPITTWIDPNTGNTGAEYLTNYINNGLATNVYVSEVDTKTEENKSAIETNAEKFQVLISSVDKYSVGEYSQAYGLTREQAASILKPGYIYIPTNNFNKCCDLHPDGTHCETMWENAKEKEKGESGLKEINEFTPGDYYVWGINDQGEADWIEHNVGNVVISKDMPEVSNGKPEYWYIDSNNAPEGYEPYALYIWEEEKEKGESGLDGKWTKVNILSGNANNRITSMIRQTADEIALEVANARGSYAGLDERLTEVDAQIQLATFWTDPDEGTTSMANLGLKSDDGGSTMSLIVRKQNDENQDVALNGANIILSADDDKSYISFDADHINFDVDDFKITAKHIDLNGAITANGTFSIDEEGYMVATGGTIGNWKIDSSSLSNRIKYDVANEDETSTTVTNNVIIQSSSASDGKAFAIGKANGDYLKTDPTTWDYPFYIRNDGYLYATKGKIGGCDIDEEGTLKITNANIGEKLKAESIEAIDVKLEDITITGKLYFGGNTTYYINANYEDSSYYIYLPGFQVDESSGAVFSGTLSAASGDFEGKVTATSGSFSRDITIGGRSISQWMTSGGYIKNISATSGSIGGMYIGTDGIYNSSGTKRIIGIHDSNQSRTYVYASSLEVSGAFTADDGVTGSTIGGSLGGTWKAKSGAIINFSDKKRKNSISALSNSYEVLFDNLQSVRYKLNNGESGRYHIGFIAQDVKTAIENAGLTTQECAAYCKWIEEEDGEQVETCGLRYEEFIALNTQQIQKAKARITELENEVTTLKEQVAQLIKGE